MDHISIGLDIGHSSTKLLVSTNAAPEERYQAIFPTSVTPAIKISSEETARRALEDTVTLNDRSYFIGDTALKQGRLRAFSGQNPDWITTETHDTLVLGAWKKAFSFIDSTPKSITLAMGLPTAFYAAQKNALKARIESLIRPLLQPEQAFKVLVCAQSEAALQNLVFKKNGDLNTNRTLSRETWGVIEVGHYTVDFSLCHHGDMIERASGSCSGVCMVYERLATEFLNLGYSADLMSIDQAIKQKRVLSRGIDVGKGYLIREANTALQHLVVDEATRLFSDYIDRLNGIIVAGGGADSVFNALFSKFHYAEVISDPILAVAEGLCRLGHFAHKSKS